MMMMMMMISSPDEFLVSADKRGSKRLLLSGWKWDFVCRLQTMLQFF